MTSLLENTPTAWSRRADDLCSPHDAVGWSIAGQRERFDAVLAALKPRAGELLLDYGCGTGALTEHLPGDVDYIGYDWSPGMVARASVEHPDRRFTTSHPRRADLVACIGTFNLPGNWSKQHTWHVIRHLWDTTGCRAIAISLYSGHDGRCLIYTAEEAVACGKQLGYYASVTRLRANDRLLEVNR